MLKFIQSVILFQFLIFSVNASSIKHLRIIHHNFRNIILKHQIISGFFHKSGTLDIRGEKKSDKFFDAIFDYTVRPRLLVPFPKKYKKGTYTTTLPLEFFTKEGYDLLAKEKILINDKATLKFLGYEDINHLKRAYKLQVFPISGKWSAILYYHPSVKGLGWVKTQLTINKVPLIGKYTLKSELIDLK